MSTIKRISQYAKRIQSAWKAIPWKKIRLFAVHFWRRIAMPAVCVILCFALIATCFASIISSAVVDYTEDRIVTPEQLKELSIQFDYILILGCGVYDDGSPTPMLRDRVSVGVSLYQLGICDLILMSGDHEKDSYNEVGPMRDLAIAGGVPADAIVLDHLGVSTYDSIYRAVELFGGKRILIVTQEYHLPRALYIADKMGIEAYGVGSDLRPYRDQIQYSARELFARFKDVYWTEANGK